MKNRTQAPSDWKLFRVKIIGRAKSYAQASLKLVECEKKESVLTQESDEELEDVHKKIENEIHRNQLLQVQAELANKLGTDATDYKRNDEQEIDKTDLLGDVSEESNMSPASDDSLRIDHQLNNQAEHIYATCTKNKSDAINEDPLHIDKNKHSNAEMFEHELQLSSSSVHLTKGSFSIDNCI